jgi:tRNA A-37 threonylcarbamoyl transferase component Bud32/quercetin dioxygenase-like cupin family protein
VEPQSRLSGDGELVALDGREYRRWLSGEPGVFSNGILGTETSIGRAFLDYRIEEPLGQGGMGVVYAAQDTRLKRKVALKLMAPELALDERFRERFVRESELAMSLEHPNVVPIHDAGEADGRLYLVMRCVEGTDLRALLRAGAALEPGRALALVRQIGEALDAAHARGLVHRDVKPSNVLLDEREHVYLADFGLTRRQTDQVQEPGEARSLGTPAYLAPEQIEGGPIDGRADLYSLGCLLYECLTGQPPFPGGSRLEVGWAHLEEDPPAASARNPTVPVAIDDVIRKAMAKDPDERYATCGELVAAAEAALGLRRSPASGRRGVALAAALAASAAIGATLVVRAGGDEPARRLVAGRNVTKPMVIEPGGTTGWHTHPGPVLVTVNSGVLKLVYADDATCEGRTYRTGESYVDRGDKTAHTGLALGAAKVVLSVTYLVPGEPGTPTRIDAPNPGNCPF